MKLSSLISWWNDEQKEILLYVNNRKKVDEITSYLWTFWVLLGLHTCWLAKDVLLWIFSKIWVSGGLFELLGTLIEQVYKT